MSSQHPDFYCRDLVLQVEDTLFRVPRFIFEASEVFQDMLGLPQAECGTKEGSDDEHPLILAGYRAHDFEQLLKVILPRQYPFEKPSLTLDEWMSVLTLATTWNFAAVYSTAYREVDERTKHDPISRLIVAKRFSELLWFVPAIAELARRDAPIGSEDCQRLMELGNPVAVCQFIAKICAVRESFRPPLKIPAHSSQCGRWNNSAVIDGCVKHSGGSFHNCSIMLEDLIQQAQALRAKYDFTEAIKNIFDCEMEDTASWSTGDSTAPRRLPELVPKPSSWDFS